MSLDKIHLRKLLKIFDLPDRQRRKVLLDDIRSGASKEVGDEDGGGDFHSPFWADAKDHVRGKLDLETQTKVRIASNNRRARLYPLLSKGFLEWWNEKRRWRNEDFKFIAESVKAQFAIRELGATIKVENLLAVRIGNHTNRIVYPYFSEEPRLSPEGARLGLWLVNQALPQYQLDDLRLLDVLRSTSFASRDVPFEGNERDLFLQKYESALREWKKLKRERGE